MTKLYKVLFSSSKKSFLFISFIIFLSLFSFLFTGNLFYSIEKYISESSKDFLGADAIITPEKQSIDEINNYIKKESFAETSQKISFETSIFYNNKPDLYSIHFIEENYPFYGSFETNEVSSSGNLIVSKKIYDRFQNNPIKILGKEYTIKSYLSEDFLADFNPFGGNDIYLPYSEKEVLGFGEVSRVRYQILLKTSDLSNILEDDFLKKWKINTEETSNNRLNNITSRFNVFIQIFYQIIILLTFFIISISLNSYFKKITKDIKTLNILGLSNYKIIGSIFLIFIGISILSSGLGYVIIYLLFHYFGGQYNLPGLDINLLYQSIFLSFLIISSGSFLHLIQLKSTSINNFSSIYLLKNFKKYIFIYILFLFSILFFISFFSGVSFLSSNIISIGFLIIMLILIMLVRSILSFLFRILQGKFKNNFYLFDAIRSTVAPGNLSVIIIISTFISITGFLIFTTFSNGFIHFLDKNTQGQIDTFVINLNETDIEVLEKNFNPSQYYEIIQSRIIKINEKKLKDHLGQERVSGRFSREFNTTTKNLDNILLEGQSLSSGEVGIDKDFSITLGVDIGDTITFLVLGIEKELRISQIRKSERDGISPFFYFNFFKDDFEGFSKNYFLSYNAQEKGPGFNKQISQKFGPQVTFIDIGNVIQKIQKISDYILTFVYLILGYISIFSIITFIISIRFLESFKQKKLTLYHKFGGNIQKLKQAIIYEYSYLISLGFLFSMLFSLIISLIIFQKNSFITFEFTYFISPLFTVFIFLIFYILFPFLRQKHK
ncbi:MAG: hypothetical protein GY828_06715 [Candidatus Gracilibacteria bacterium]|nr:hypothetical protein [Candidatus Gracilibacteria bacterium]